MQITLQIICENLPSQPLLLGIQRGEEAIDTVPTSLGQAIFTAHFDVLPQPDGKTNFRGPYAKGTPAVRFFYLVWLEDRNPEPPVPSGRTKVHLSHLPWARVEEHLQSGQPFTVRLSLSNERGLPRYASLPDHAVRWEI